jgi:hypothetical protein
MSKQLSEPLLGRRNEEDEDVDNPDGATEMEEFGGGLANTTVRMDDLKPVEHGPKKKNLVHRLKGYFRRRPQRLFYGCLLACLLTFIMIFVGLNSEATTDAVKNNPDSWAYNWCGPASFSVGHNGYLSNCFLHIIFAFPQYINLMLLALVWFIAFRPWHAERRQSLRKLGGKDLVYGSMRLFFAFVICAVPDPHTIAHIFDTLDQNEKTPRITVITDILRTISWLLGFLILLFCTLKQVRVRVYVCVCMCVCVCVCCYVYPTYTSAVIVLSS